MTLYKNMLRIIKRLYNLVFAHVQVETTEIVTKRLKN